MKSQRFSLGLLVASLGLFLIGCGDSPAPDTKKEEARLNSAVEMRKLFDKAGGDYSKLDAADKSAFDKMAGGDGAKAFAEMKTGPSGGASTPPGG